jgi:hypothetical protein
MILALAAGILPGSSAVYAQDKAAAGCGDG